MALFQESDRLRWVSQGQRVTLVLDDGRGLPCVVRKAAGDMAEVEAENKSGTHGGLCIWVDVWRLFPAIPAEVQERMRSDQRAARKRIKKGEA